MTNSEIRSLSNDIDTFDAISFLFLCNKLENLVLKGNPIADDLEYRNRVFRILPIGARFRRRRSAGFFRAWCCCLG